jgi:hypothetical protein
MKALVIGRPKFQVPPDMAPMVTQGALDWYDRYKDRFEVFGTFMGGGGFAVVEVDGADELNKMIAEMPFAMFSEISAELFVEGDKGFRQFQDAMQAMMGAGVPG